MAESLQQLLVTNFGLTPSGYTGSQGAAGYTGSSGTAGYTGSAGAAGTGALISNIQVTNSSYTVLDDTAVDTAGGYVKITGAGFASGCTVLVNQTPATSVTFISATEVRAQLPATAAGSYIVYVVNPSGDVAIRVNGVTFSALPSWVTSSSLSGQGDQAISIQLSATSAATYTLQAGSTLPSGLTLSNVGLISGTVTGLSSDTIYNFTVVAIDAELQDSPRSFTLSISVRDPYFNYTTLLLSGDGTNNAQNNTFTDSSTNNFAITRTGNVLPGTFTPYGSNWSTLFASNTVLQFPYASALTNWWTQDFTIEMWIFNNTNAASASNNLPLQFAHGDYATSSTYWSFGTTSAGTLQFYYYNGGLNTVTSTATVGLSTWNHVAMVYTNSTGNISLYLNGVSVASATKSGTPQSSSGNTLNIGAVQGSYYNGYISNLRILNGTALYTSSFTPSTTPLTAVANTQLLTCQSNRFRDNSTNNATATTVNTPKIQRFSPFAPSASYSTSTTGSSAYIDGSTTSYLSLTTTTAFTLEAIALATYNWTIEAWVYHTGGGMAIFDSRTGGDYSNWCLNINSNNLDFVVSDSAYRFTTTGGKVLPYQWNHVALVHTESTYAFYINGVASGTKSFYGQGPWQTIGRAAWIGRFKDPGQSTGYISDFRFVKGTAVYTAAFTPPTAPLTAISGTVFFLNSNAGGVVDRAMQNNLLTVGDAKISTTQSKFGGSSIYLDGTGDYLVTAPNMTNNLGTGDFTIEAWVYLTSGSTYQFFIGSSDNASGYMMIGINVPLSPTSTIAIGRSGINWPVQFGAGTTITSNTWTHIAITRSGTTNRAFINGTQLGSNVTDSTSWSFPSNTMWIGMQSGGTSFNGYIDDLRITNGYARYTTNFTPSSSAFNGQ